MPRDITPMPQPFAGFHLNLKLIIPGLIVFLLLIGSFTSFYTIPADSDGVVQRFGKYKESVGPGLHFKIPFGVDSVTVVPLLRQLKMEFGFATPGATNRDQSSDSREQEEERSMVTGDLNAAQVEWVVQYDIRSPSDYLFNVRSPGPTLRDFSESVMREVVGDRTVDEVLTYGRAEIEADAMKKLSESVEKLGMGLRVIQVQLTRVHPPPPVQRSFDEVSRAQQEKQQMINVAEGEYNKVVPRASGEATQKLSEAEGYAVKRINEAQGDVARFKALLEQYEKAPDVTRQRLYFETMSEVIPNLGSKIILDSDAKQFLPLMNLQQLQYAKPQPPQR
ncbi:MAG: FtsH protease activity modulator HflK [Verrucomicrobiaceae bacterium]